MTYRQLRWRSTLAFAAAMFVGQAGATELLNASYDVARAFYKDLNPAFVEDWKKKTGETLTIDQSHGGSSKQARAVIDGLEADVVSMNNPLDIDAIAKAGLLPVEWQSRLPNHSSPSWSPILFIVRKGNPKGIKDWDDLIKPGVQVIIPNPKTSGNGRYSYLAAWQYARSRPGGSDDAAKAFEQKLFGNVPVLDTGGRGATTTFAQRELGDVLLTFENEVSLIREEFGADKFQVVVPSLTVRADNPIALVDKIAGKKNTTEVAQAYLQFHYTAAAQELFAKNGLRPIDAAVLKAHSGDFPALNVFEVDKVFGGWPKAQADHFADGANVRPDHCGSASLTTYHQHADSMNALAPTASIVSRRAPKRAIPGFGPTLGFTILYLSLIVLIPLAGVFFRASGLGLDGLWRVLTGPRVLNALTLSFGTAFIAAAINAVFGSIVAWVFVRYEFPGKRLLDAVIDLPFALPTAVAGIALTALYAPNGWIGELITPLGIKVAYTRLGIVVALTFIGLPFIVRTVEPVLREVEKDLEEAAATLGAARWHTVSRVILPAVLPALVTGFALSFARGVGEYGSVIFIAGNFPNVTEIAPLLITIKLDEFDYRGATAIAAAMLVISFLLLLVINLLQAWARRRA